MDEFCIYNVECINRIKEERTWRSKGKNNELKDRKPMET